MPTFPVGGVRGAAVLPTSSVASGRWSAMEVFKYRGQGEWPDANRVQTTDIIFGSDTSPYVFAYPWEPGFGTKYADPSTAVTALSFDVQFTFPATDVAVTFNSGAKLHVYPWDAGFGTRYATVGTLTGNYEGLSFSPENDAIVFGLSSSTWQAAYPFTSGTGVGSRYASPATPLDATVFSTAFHPDGNYLALGATFTSATLLFVYEWSASTGYGSKVANPATLPPSTVIGIAWHPDGTDIVTASTATPFQAAYPWLGSSFGTKYADPAVGIGAVSRDVSMHPDGDAVIFTRDASPWLHAYAWSAGYGTKFADPASTPSDQGRHIEFSQDGLAVAYANDATPYAHAWEWSPSGFGTKYANPATLPGSSRTRAMSFAAT